MLTSAAIVLIDLADFFSKNIINECFAPKGPGNKVFGADNDGADGCAETLAQAYGDGVTGCHQVLGRRAGQLGRIEEAGSVTVQGKAQIPAGGTHLEEKEGNLKDMAVALGKWCRLKVQNTF